MDVNYITIQFKGLISSPYLWAALAAYIIGQLTKVSLLVGKKRVTLREFFSSGNMPSTHTASIVALTVVIGMREGLGSSLFGVAFMLMLIVAYDAMHVRRAVGEQGLILMKMISEAPKEKQEEYSKLIFKNTGRQTDVPYFSRGHLPEEVAAGGLLGLLVGLAIGLIVH